MSTELLSSTIEVYQLTSKLCLCVSVPVSSDAKEAVVTTPE